MKLKDSKSKEAHEGDNYLLSLISLSLTFPFLDVFSLRFIERLSEGC